MERAKKKKIPREMSKRLRYKNSFRYPVNEDDQSRIGRRGSRVEMILTNGRIVDTRRARFLPSASIQPSGILLKGRNHSFTYCKHKHILTLTGIHIEGRIGEGR